MDLSVYFYTIWKRKLIVLITTLAVVAVVTWGSLQAAPTYEAVTRLRIVPYSLGAPDYGSYVYFDRLAHSYSDLINSSIVTARAREQLNLKALPSFELGIIPETELMRLSVADTNPQRAQEVANTLAALLIEENQTSYMSDPGIQDSFREHLDQLGTQIDTLTAEYTRLFNEIPRDNERLSEIRRMIDNLQQSYNRLLDSASQATILSIARANALTVVEPAALPVAPISPDPQRDLLLAVLVGTVTGIALAFVFESFNPHVYTSAQVEAATQAHIITRIPRVKKSFRADVFAGDRIAAGAFRRLRTYLTSELGRTMPCYLLVTSAVPGEGKTSTAANLALAFASSGHDVLLVDADMLRPTLHRIYRLSNLAGLSTVLTRRSTVADTVQELAGSTLHILCAGPSTSRSAELLSSSEFDQFLDEVMETYDYIIFDSPAVLAAADPLIIAERMSRVLWVMDQRKVDQRTLAYTYEQLDRVGAKVAGVVANRVRNDKNAYWGRHYGSSSGADEIFDIPPQKRRKTEMVKL